MKINIKKKLALLVLLAITSTSFLSAFAYNIETHQDEEKLNGVLVMSSESYDNPSKAVDLIDANYNRDEIVVSEEYAISQRNPLLRYGESEKSYIQDTLLVTRTVTPIGQPSNGTRGTGSIYIDGGSGNSINFSVSMPLSWLNIPASIGLSFKSGSQASYGGFMINLPDNTNYYRAKIDKTVRLDYVKVDCYQYNQYKYTYYTTWNSDYSNYYYVVKV